VSKEALVTVQADPGALRRLEARLDGAYLLRDGMRRLLRQAAEEGDRAVQSRVPIGGTYQLWMSIDHAVDPRPLPLWAKVTANATNRGFRYGWALQASKKIVYRYRAGTRAGRPTRRWFSGARARVRKRLKEQVALLRRDIEAKWRR